MAQSAGGEATDVEGVVVTGYRASLGDALRIKRASNDLIDVIRAEDIAAFPDLNLAESLQRIPGVSIDRDGGEGRSITVRGLSNDFSRVRLDGMEALATTGGKDGSGGANRGRGFDFQVFAAELFNQVTVRKAQAAEIEEGSLGATIDLTPAKPFDYKGFQLAGGVQYGYNDLSRAADPRATLLMSNRWLDGRLGALVSLAYSARHINEEEFSSGRWESPAVPTNTSGCFQTPGPCNSPTGVYSAVNSAWHARIPRYGRLAYDWQRYGGTVALQFQMTDATRVSLDGLYALMTGTRREAYLSAASFSRNGQGMGQTDVLNPVIDAQNQLVKATFNDVDIRNEARLDELSTAFDQTTLSLDHDFSERLKVKAMIGVSRNVQDNPVQTSVSIDRYDTQGYVYDFTASQTRPGLTYGFDVTDPANWTFSPSAAKGDPSFLRMRPNKAVDQFKTASLDLTYEVNPGLTLKAGVLAKDFGFRSEERRRYAISGITDGAVALPGVGIAQITSLLDGFGRGLGVPAGTPTTWLVPSVDKIAQLVDLYCNCVNAYGDFRVSLDNQLAANRAVTEHDRGGYLQADFETSMFGMPLRGDVGVRQADTRSVAEGYVTGKPVSVSHHYSDTLPAMNLVLEPRDNVLIRLGMAKVMSRPQLPFMTPGGSLSNTARTLTIGNPLLDPIRATTVDLSLEWYPVRGAQLTLGLFQKKIQSYIQTSATTEAYGLTGLPATLLTNGNTVDTVFLVTQLQNTKGGDLKGYEVNLQGPFSFLPAPFDRFGGIANYTHVRSEVLYITDASARPAATAMLPLTGLSPNAWNLTLYYEGPRLSGRISTAYRDGYLTLVPGGNGNDARGKGKTLNVDLSAAYKLSDRLTLTLEGVNLTDQFEDRWVSSTRRNADEYSHTGRQVLVGARFRF